MSRQTLEGHIKAGFSTSEVYDSESHYGHIRIMFYDVFSSNMASNICKWIMTALKEKQERDFGEPLRWIKVPEDEVNMADYEYDCPKCKERLYFYEGEMTDYDYCPHCGQRLLPPEEEKTGGK